MKKNIITIVLCILSNISFAQMIQSFECFKTQESDSCTAVYSIKVVFNTHTTDATRLSMVKEELNKSYGVEMENIVSIQSWAGKRFRTFLYTVKVKNLEGGNSDDRKK